MNYIINNKAAWEEAFEHRRPNWGDENCQRPKDEKLPFFNEDIRNELEKMDFKNLKLLFDKVSKFLKPNGLLLINDFHPFVNMLPFSGEDCFDGDNLNRLVYSYFRKEPWIENNGMGYMSIEYRSKTFTSFSHTMSAIINSLSANGMKTILPYWQRNVRVSKIDHFGLSDLPVSRKIHK